MPRHPTAMLTAFYMNPRESADKFYDPLMLAVNSYTGEGEIVASRL